jgi:serine O-acetyltransferase
MGSYGAGDQEALIAFGHEVRRVREAWRAMAQAVRADHAMMHHYDSKYEVDGRHAPTALGRDMVTRIGFQMLAACRFMHFWTEVGVPLAPQVASRLIRHLYGADVHWEADLEPGIVIVHGMGLAISRAARVEHGAILFKNVTLGLGIDPESRATGAPVVEHDVHVGAGTTLFGPIRVGARSKVTANCCLRTSVPPDSLVEAPVPTVSVRTRAGDGPQSGVGS